MNNSPQNGFYARQGSSPGRVLVVAASLMSMGMVAAVVIAPYVAAVIVTFR